MNYNEWWSLPFTEQDHYWQNKAREILLSFKYNTDRDAVVIHHLLDTEEQRRYNSEHYEMWGFEIDDDGNEHFEYGKYVVFVTKEEHRRIHKHTDDTKRKIKEHHAKYWLGKHLSEETKKKLHDSNVGKQSGERHWNYGRHWSDEMKEKFSVSHNGQIPWIACKHHTEESNRKNREASKKRLSIVSKAYHEYKDSGGELNWQHFQKMYKELSNVD